MCTQLDIAYICTTLGQYNAQPTRTVAFAAKHVLLYLAEFRNGGNHITGLLGTHTTTHEGDIYGIDGVC